MVYIKYVTLLMGIALFSSSSYGRDVTLYRTILAKAESESDAEKLRWDSSDIVEEDGAFLVVYGWHKTFLDAYPPHAKEEWNKQWKHVYPVDMPMEEAEQKGFEFAPLLGDQARDDADGIVLAQNLARVKADAFDIIETVQALEQDSKTTKADLMELLEPEIPRLAILAERTENQKDAETAQFWLAKTFYLMGLEQSEERLPMASGLLERYAWPEEELAYDSAMEEFKEYLNRFPDSERAEEVAYHIAATSYHLTYRGHHRRQVEKAQQAYEDFIQNYPNSGRVPRAYMNLLGISLELARMDDKGYDKVIEFGMSLLENYPDAGAYILSRAKMIMAESYYDGFQDYKTSDEMCTAIIEEYSKEEKEIGWSILSTAYRLKAYNHFFMDNYNAAVASFNFYLDFYTGPKFNLGYQEDENIAAAYYWRGKCLLKLGRNQLAREDFETVIELFPHLGFAKDAQFDLKCMSR